MPTITANGLQLSYEISGDGHPLLLISGIGYGAWFWHSLIPLLSPHFQVISFDNRGSGQSDKPEGPYSLANMAADTAGLLDALNLKPAAILGHSLGGFIAQEIAVSRPDLLSHLILASTSHGGPNAVPITQQAIDVLTNRTGDIQEVVKRGIAVAAEPGLAERDPDLAQALLNYRLSAPVPPAAYAAQTAVGLGMAAFTEADVAKRLSAIHVPTLILSGEHDLVVPSGNAALLAQKIPNAQLAILPNTGHIFPLEAPELTAQLITTFLNADIKKS